MEEVYMTVVQLHMNVLNELENIDVNINCKVLLIKFLINFELLNSDSLLKIEAILDYMYEQVYSGKWAEVKLCLRKAITIASYLKLLVYLKVNKEVTDNLLKELFKIIDHGILFGCPLTEEPELLQKCASIINPLTSNTNIESSQIATASVNNLKYNPCNVLSIDVLDCPSMETFFRDYLSQNKPVILENCINHWPALEKWKDQNYFIKLAGMRTIPVELGRDYTNEDWGQKLMTMEEFIKSHIFCPDGPIGYLAQYQLFNHIPELKQDIIVPEYCCFSDNDKGTDIMSWFGPKGTLSPLHYDAKKNLLAQVVGDKHMFLFPPKDSEYLYPYDDELLHNTAQVDPRNPDFEKFPKYKEVKPYYCTLSAGQMLYIPPKWWHCVESLSVSFSVSFWWE